MKSIDEDTHNVGSCERMNPGSKLGPPAHPFLFEFQLRERVREARAAAFQEQRKLSTFSRAAQAEHRLQPRESRPLEFCHNCRAIQSYL